MTEIICHAASRVVHNQDNFILLPSEKKLIARAHQVHPIGAEPRAKPLTNLAVSSPVGYCRLHATIVVYCSHYYARELILSYNPAEV